jgi:hypothetical protein
VLRPPVGAGGHEDQVVAGPDEVEQLVAPDPSVRRDGGHVVTVSARADVLPWHRPWPGRFADAVPEADEP